ncbi:glk [Scenedesmus sp. PABB004]|nr:glk [Scenedesmus sp. PABB004]
MEAAAGQDAAPVVARPVSLLSRGLRWARKSAAAAARPAARPAPPPGPVELTEMGSSPSSSGGGFHRPSNTAAAMRVRSQSIQRGRAAAAPRARVLPGARCPRPAVLARRGVAAASTARPTTFSIITGDIGGTNARLSLWKCEEGGGGGGAGGAQQAEVFSETYATTAFPTFEDCLQAFLDESEVRGAGVQAAALAVAGAVENNRCPMTNTSWVIDGRQLGAQFKFRTAVLNDFEAVGYGIPALAPSDLVPLNDVPMVPTAPKVVMGPGTGLGAAQLFWDSGVQGYKVVPGEGAHATFAPRGWRQMALTAYVTARLGHCEIEEVACGRGLELIYEFLLSDPTFRRPDGRPAAAAAKVAPEITAEALEGEPTALAAVDIFLAIIGAEAGAMALRCLARGGVFIAGGIVPRLMDRVRGGGLLDAFLNRSGRERFTYLLQGMPLFVVTNTRVGIIGSREYALRMVREARGEWHERDE